MQQDIVIVGDESLTASCENLMGIRDVWTNEDIEVAGITRNTVVGNRESPTTRYSTALEVNNATNSRKSLVSGIGIFAIAEFDHKCDALARRHRHVLAS